MVEARIPVELTPTQAGFARVVAGVESGASLDGGRPLEGWCRLLVARSSSRYCERTARVVHGRLGVSPRA